MTQAITRATSFGASALLMAGAVLLALTMTYTVSEPDRGSPPGPVEMMREPTPPPPTPPRQPQTQRLDQPVDISPRPPLNPVSTIAPETPYVGPVAPVGPHWLEQPRNLDRYYPRRAIERNIEGAVVLDCLVRVSGLLDCDVVSESPMGWGFSQAALRIAGAYRMAPATRSGVAVEGRYTMRVPFQIE